MWRKDFPSSEEIGQGFTNMAVSETAVLPDQDIAGKTGGRDLLVAIGLVGFASWLLELVLTRLFSVALFYHFAFLAISITLLGLGGWRVRLHLARLASGVEHPPARRIHLRHQPGRSSGRTGDRAVRTCLVVSGVGLVQT